jgi:hypothetical protein
MKTLTISQAESISHISPEFSHINPFNGLVIYKIFTPDHTDEGKFFCNQEMVYISDIKTKIEKGIYKIIS